MPGDATRWMEALRFSSCEVELEFTSEARGFGAFHGSAVHGLLSEALRGHALVDRDGTHHLPLELSSACPEFGAYTRRAGERYHFRLMWGGEDRRFLAQCVEAIRTLGARTAEEGRKHRGAMAGNFRVVTADISEPMGINDVLLSPGGTVGSLCLHLRSPFVIRGKNREAMTAPSFSAARLFRAVARRALGLRVRGDGGRAVEPSEAELDEFLQMLPPSPPVSVGELHTFRAERAGEGRGDAIHASRRIVGIIGYVNLITIDPDWQRLLALASLAGAGQSTGHGFGAMELEGKGVRPITGYPSGRSSLLARALEPRALQRAEAHVRGKTPDEVEYSSAEWERLPEEVARCTDRIARGEFTPAPAVRFSRPKTNSVERRWLAASPLHERVVQRAVHETLVDFLDRYLESGAHGYRRGRSVHSAIAMAQRMRKSKGWVLDADIHAFFDNVNWETMDRTCAMLIPDAAMRRLIAQWMRIGVRHGKVVEQRAQGLPQGMGLSPLLANLYLDPLDETLHANGFDYVRYADDFVVFAESRAAIERAAELVRLSLARAGLVLHAEKTRIAAPEETVSFLGQEIAASRASGENARATEERGASSRKARRAGRMRAEAVVIEAPTRDTAPATTIGAGDDSAPPAESNATVRDDAAPTEEGSGMLDEPGAQPVFITDPQTVLFLRGGKLVRRVAVSAEGESGEPVDVVGGDEAVLPLRCIESLTLFGATRMTVPLLLQCTANGVPVYICAQDGALLHSSVGPVGLRTLVQQWRCVRDKERRLGFARTLVTSKLHNSAVLLSRLAGEDREQLAGPLRTIRTARDLAERAEDVESLRGHEGAGAAAYFAGMRVLLKDGWGFDERISRDAPDPVNALLSLGYRVLHNYVATALVRERLEARIGIYHRGRGAHHALASDVMEPFRYLIDGIVVRQLRSGVWSTSDLGWTGERSESAGERYRLPVTAVSQLIRLVEERSMEGFTPPGGKRMRYQTWIAAYARFVRQYVRGEIAALPPFQIVR